MQTVNRCIGSVPTSAGRLRRSVHDALDAPRRVARLRGDPATPGSVAGARIVTTVRIESRLMACWLQLQRIVRDTTSGRCGPGLRDPRLPISEARLPGRSRDRSEGDGGQAYRADAYTGPAGHEARPPQSVLRRRMRSRCM